MSVSASLRPEGGIQTLARRWLAPPSWAGCAAVLLIALIFGGGTYQRSWPDAVVQVASIPLLFSALSQVRMRWSEPWIRVALLITGAIVALPLLQLVPLPPSLWTRLPGRDFVAQGFLEVLNDLPWFPISLSPAETWRSALSLLPPVAIFLAVLGLDRAARRALTLILIGFVFLSVVVGLAQAAQGPTGPFRFYGASTAAEGFFINRNHFAALLYATIPFTAAWVVGLVADRRPHIVVGTILCLLIFASLLLGLGIARSRAGLVLAVVAALASFALARTRGADLPKARAGRFILAGAFAGALLVFQFAALGILQRLEADPLADSRWEMNTVTFRAAQDFLPFGSGFGTFDSVYMMYESVALLEPTYANNAHDDFAEAFLEGGLLAAALFLAFLAFYFARTVRIWRKPVNPVRALDLSLSRAASISIALLLLHSAVDYPLRSAALSGIFAMCCTLMLPAPLSTSNRSSGEHAGKVERKRKRRSATRAPRTRPA